MHIISIDKDAFGGQPVFTGTSVSVELLFDQLEAGFTLEDFLTHFPSVSKEQALALLESALPFGFVITKPS